jgi:uncharacterized membrane protein HdeD (DUF308 family)
MSEAQGLLRALDRSVHHVGKGLIILGGVAAIAPLASGLAMAVIIGLILLAAGGLVALFGRRARAAGKGSLALGIGALTAVCGLVLVVQPSAGLTIVRWILIPYLFLSGASELALAWRLRPADGWTATLGEAVVSLLAALALLSGWPVSGARAIGLLIGAKLITTGWAILRVQRTIETAAQRLRDAAEALAQRHHP